MSQEPLSQALSWFMLDLPSPFLGQMALAKHRRDLSLTPLPKGAKVALSARCEADQAGIAQLCARPPHGHPQFLAALWLGIAPESSKWAMELHTLPDGSCIALHEDGLGQACLEALLAHPKGTLAFILAQQTQPATEALTSAPALRRSGDQISAPRELHTLDLASELQRSARDQMGLLLITQRRALISDPGSEEALRVLSCLETIAPGSAVTLGGARSDTPALRSALRRALGLAG